MKTMNHIKHIAASLGIMSLFMLFGQFAQAQVGVGTDNPSSKAILHMESSDKGLLIPKMTNSQMDAMTIGGNPETGTLVYNTDVNEIFAFKNGKWYSMTPFQRERSSNVTKDTIVAATTSAGNPLKVTSLHATSGYGIVPLGTIVMWSGTTIPDGWTLCNGVTNNGITPPNLSGRFVVGIGSNGTTSYSHTNIGGLDWVTLSASQMPQHNHTFTTSSNGNHTHQIERLPYDSQGSGISMQSMMGSSNNDEGWTGVDTRTRGASISTNGNHHHSGTTGYTGSSTAHENRPAYYAIAYIMRVK